MLMLAIDTSTTVRVAVATTDDAAPEGARVLARRVEEDPRRHVELLAPAVRAVLADAGVARRSLTHVVVGTGPAPFTGLRVGIATALVLAEALGVPVGGLCSLDAVAATAARQARGAGEPLAGEVVAVADAKRREVHWARYVVDPEGAAGAADVEGLPVRLDGPHVGPPSSVAPGPLVGPGAALCGSGADGALAAGGLDPGVLAVMALRRLAAGEDLEPPLPRYLRRPDAQPLAGAHP